jgi:hypothetical protein
MTKNSQNRCLPQIGVCLLIHTYSRTCDVPIYQQALYIYDAHWVATLSPLNLWTFLVRNVHLLGIYISCKHKLLNQYMGHGQIQCNKGSSGTKMKQFCASYVRALCVPSRAHNTSDSQLSAWGTAGGPVLFIRVTKHVTAFVCSCIQINMFSWEHDQNLQMCLNICYSFSYKAYMIPVWLKFCCVFARC